MPSKPSNQRSRRTRRAIQEAAVELLRTEGVSAVTMAGVAARAGCSRRALYLHFASRAELFVSLIAFTDEVEDIAAARQRMDSAESPEALLRALGAFLGDYHWRIAPVVRAIALHRETDAAAAEIWAEAMGRWRRACLATCRDLRRDDRLAPRFDSAEEAADLMWSLMSPEILHGLVEERGWSPERYGTLMGELFVATFLTPQGLREASY